MMLCSVINAQGKEEEGRKFLVMVFDSQATVTRAEALHARKWMESDLHMGSSKCKLFLLCLYMQLLFPELN